MDYSTRHKLVKQARGRAREYTCEHCGGAALTWATIHGREGVDPQDYIPLCSPCHVRYDFTEETSRKHSEAMKRVWAETHDQRQATLRQPYASPEVRQRVSEGTRRGQAAAEPRDYASDEYRQKLSDSITAWNAKRRAEGKHRLKLTEELVQQIWQAYQEMEPKNMNKIAVQFGVSPTHTRRIIHQMEAS